MTNAELLAKIKAEIEKTWLEYECYNEDYDKVAEMSWNEFENVASHFYELGKQSSSSEKPMQEGLEEEIERTYHNGSVADTSDLDHNSYENIARHFAQWGAEHFRDTTKMISGSSEIPNDLEEAAKNYALNTAEDSEQYSARYLGYKDGAKWQKEQDEKDLSEKIAAAYQLGLADKEKQMMQEAVEHYVVGEIAGRRVGPAIVHFDKNFIIGDKVRVIICKKEDEK